MMKKCKSPRKPRRRVEVDEPACHHEFIAFKVHSYSKEGLTHYVTLDTASGMVVCSCPHFRFNLEKHWPKISDASEKLCKHCLAVIRSTRVRLAKLEKTNG